MSKRSVILLVIGICLVCTCVCILGNIALVSDGWCLGNSGVIQKRIYNPEFPDREVVATVVRNDFCRCGPNHVKDGCHLKVRVGVPVGYFEPGHIANGWEVYESCEACDATISTSRNDVDVKAPAQGE